MPIRTMVCRASGKTLGAGISLILMLLGGGLLGGCAPSSALLRSEKPSSAPGNALLVVLLPTDIELYEVTAAGLLEPKAEWTRVARSHVQDALKAELRSRNDVLTLYRKPADEDVQNLHEQLFKLHDVVGQTIIRHKFLAKQGSVDFELPTKRGGFDWSLGPATRTMRQDNADYGLFVYIRDSYTSSGRAAIIFAAALLGSGLPPGGRLVAIGSLVDLRTGHIAWFNLLNSPRGDLRSADTARETVAELLTDLPL